jgi:hypothetical protein
MIDEMPPRTLKSPVTLRRSWQADRHEVVQRAIDHGLVEDALVSVALQIELSDFNSTQTRSGTYSKVIVRVGLTIMGQTDVNSGQWWVMR